MPLKRLRSPNSTPEKADKSAKMEKCVKCKENVIDDCIACDWCLEWEHRSCANISHTDLELLGSAEKENIAFFCSHCLPNVSDALTLYQIYYRLDSEFDIKFQSMEDQLHKGISLNVAKHFEVANVAGLENACKKLQASVDELGLKIANLSRSNSNLVMEIDNASESLTESSQAEPALVPPRPNIGLMNIIDELADREKRKRNIIVYNLPEPSSESDSDVFSTLCSSVYGCSFSVAKSLRLGKKTEKCRPLLISLCKEEDKFELLSRSFLLRRNESYKNVFLAPDRTKLEREKHKSLVSELRARRTRGESGLVIRNGNIVKVKSQESKDSTQQHLEDNTDTAQQSVNDKIASNQPSGGPFPGYRMFRRMRKV